MKKNQTTNRNNAYLSVRPVTKKGKTYDNFWLSVDNGEKVYCVQIEIKFSTRKLRYALKKAVENNANE